MARKSAHNLPPGIQLDQHGAYWATLEGDDAKLWKARHPGRSLPRRKATTLKDAIRMQRQLVDDLKAARDPNANNPKVVDWVRTCIDRKRDLAPGTALRYRSSLKWQIEPHRIGRMRLLQVLDRHVEEWIDELIVQPHQRHNDRTLDPYSIRNAFALLRMAFNMAIPKLITINPCKGVKLPAPDDEEIRPLTPEQVGTLLAYLDRLVHDKATGWQRPHRNAALYHVAIRCGLREGEIIGLRWTDIDLKRRELRVAGQIQKGTRRKTKSGDRGRRTIPLSLDLVDVLEWHRRNQIEERAIAGENWNAAGLVFCSENGTPINPSNLNHQFDRFLRHAELPDLRFHHLRHTYAALNIAAGVDLYTLSRRMGHSSITVTADKYGHLYQGQTQDADALDRLLKRSA
jgi:integrase